MPGFEIPAQDLMVLRAKKGHCPVCDAPNRELNFNPALDNDGYRHSTYRFSCRVCGSVIENRETMIVTSVKVLEKPGSKYDQPA